MNRAGNRRFDIQLLRGVAVLLVLGFHGFEARLPHGYLGVDIFFVVSGFLMTRMIVAGADEGRFSFAGFYARRARRLLPASVATLAGTTVAAVFLLTSDQWRDFLWQLLGAVTFTANFMLWEQGGYFDPEIETRPLLHFWSLAVEEQFYLLFPLVLLAFPARLRAAAVVAGLVASLALFLLTNAQGHFAASFFLLPTRVWQLLAGAVCAFAVGAGPGLSIPRGVPFLALAIIALVCAGAVGTVHGPVLVVAATATILLGRDGWLPRLAPVRALARVGDWSYSLYLVHWPLLAFANVVHAGLPPPWLVLGLLASAFPLAWLQYRFVEQPFRHPRAASRPKIAALGAVAAATAALVLGRGALSADSALAVPKPVVGLSDACARDRSDPREPRCRTAPRPRVAIWGDSFAMHVVPGLLVGGGGRGGLVQLTKPSCTPIVGLARAGEEACMRFNREALREIAAPEIRAVVLAASWEMIRKDKPRPVLLEDGAVRQAEHRRIVDALIATVQRLEGLGKQVFVVGPTPMHRRGYLDPPGCNIRQLEGRPLAGKRDCAIPLAAYREAMPAVNSALERVAAETGARVFLPERALCAAGRCATRAGRLLIYRDGNHLSHEGSVHVMTRLGLGREVAAALAGQMR